MSEVNNIDLDKVRRTAERAQENGGHFPVEKTIEGTFNLRGSPMFTATLQSDYSSFTYSADEPSALGGRGVHTTPLSYLLFGVMSCYASTLAIQCALRGLKLGELRVTGKLFYDLAPVVSGEEAPIIKRLELHVHADRELGDLIEISRGRCPAVYAISHPIETVIRQD
ncbi:OsmC family protein [Thermogymnomonas acidicola]|uniref:OsmC family protein n=1 Tax=Thermogymnomonas acidicola TaxID=399579 RepID=UPI001E3D7646|nr:OsmC family protein [Thermogymnomonas acidicola]